MGIKTATGACLRAEDLYREKRYVITAYGAVPGEIQWITQWG